MRWPMRPSSRLAVGPSRVERSPSRSTWRSPRVTIAVVLAAGALVPTRAASQVGHLLVVQGLGGDPEYGELFHTWGTRLVEAARLGGLDTENIVYLAEDPERDPVRIDGSSRREDVEAAVAAIAGRAGPTDQVLIVLIGHGSFREDEARINLPGPDLSATDFARLLDQFTSQEVVFVNTASASGTFIEALSGPGRTIVTATKTGLERNQTRFGGFFVEALAGDGADIDKNGRVSILEAFEYARREVRRSYEADNQLMTEHALLDDNADGQGSEELGANTTDGGVARDVFPWSYDRRATSATESSDDPEVERLMRRRAELEREVTDLRAQKEQMEESIYQGRLEGLLLELARINRDIRDRGGEP
jgi:hypothetical protein